MPRCFAGKRQLGYFAGFLFLLSFFSSAVQGQTLTPRQNQRELQWYSDGAGGSFSQRHVALSGHVTRSTRTYESIDSVVIYFIGANDQRLNYGNRSERGWANASRDQWSARAALSDLVYYRVEVTVQRYVRAGRGWAYMGTVTRTTPRYAWRR